MKNSFGELLKELRGNLHLSLRDVEKETGISNSYLSQLERNERNIPTLNILKKLCSLYNVPITDFLCFASIELLPNIRFEPPLPSHKVAYLVKLLNKLTDENILTVTRYVEFLLQEEKSKKRNRSKKKIDNVAQGEEKVRVITQNALTNALTQQKKCVSMYKVDSEIGAYSSLKND